MVPYFPLLTPPIPKTACRNGLGFCRLIQAMVLAISGVIAAIIFRRDDEDDVVRPEHLGQLPGAIGRVLGLEILIEQRHLEIGEAEIGHLHPGLAQLQRHVAAKDFVDRTLAQ